MKHDQVLELLDVVTGALGEQELHHHIQELSHAEYRGPIVLRPRVAEALNVSRAELATRKAAAQTQ